MNFHHFEKRCPRQGRAWVTLSAALLVVTFGCHTAEGVKQDTKSALDATGKGIQKGADKIDGPKQEADAEKDTEDGSRAQD
jgi:hypothetical protein